MNLPKKKSMNEMQKEIIFNLQSINISLGEYDYIRDKKDKLNSSAQRELADWIDEKTIEWDEEDTIIHNTDLRELIKFLRGD